MWESSPHLVESCFLHGGWLFEQQAQRRPWDGSHSLWRMVIFIFQIQVGLILNGSLARTKGTKAKPWHPGNQNAFWCQIHLEMLRYSPISFFAISILIWSLCSQLYWSCPQLVRCSARVSINTANFTISDVGCVWPPFSLGMLASPEARVLEPVTWLGKCGWLMILL